MRRVGWIKVDSDGSHVSVEKPGKRAIVRHRRILPVCTALFPLESSFILTIALYQLFCIVIPRSFSAMANLLTPNVLYPTRANRNPFQHLSFKSLLSRSRPSQLQTLLNDGESFSVMEPSLFNRCSPHNSTPLPTMKS